MASSPRALEKQSSDNEFNYSQKALWLPAQAALTSAVVFAIGAIFSLLGSEFIRNHKARLVVVVAVCSITLAVFGRIATVLGRTPVVKSVVRVLIGGWLAIAIIFGLTKLIVTRGLQM